MKTIQQTFSESFRERGSKFVGYLIPARSKNNFEEKLADIHSEYPDATHHCYAWRINPDKIEEFVQDDGEPSGTAGRPILNKLKSYDMINCGCVVVRYYGGTNLGTSGLIKAYGKSAELCLEKASLETIIPVQNFEITYPYDLQKVIDQLKNRFDLKEINAQYTDKVSLTLACQAEQANAFKKTLKQLEHKGISMTDKGRGFVTFFTD